MHDLEKALGEIGDIRAKLATNAMFRGFGPRIVAITGLLALLNALAQTLWPEIFADSAQRYIWSWIAIGVIATALTATEMWARSRRIHGGLADAMLSNAAEQFLPAGVAGAAITAVILKFSAEQSWLLPGLWQIILSIGIFSAARSLTKAINIIAAWYFVSGIVVLILCAQTHQLSPWHMGLPFTAGQLAAALILKLTCEREDT